jgi:hypothetical protein
MKGCGHAAQAACVRGDSAHELTTKYKLPSHSPKQIDEIRCRLHTPSTIGQQCCNDHRICSVRSDSGHGRAHWAASPADFSSTTSGPCLLVPACFGSCMHACIRYARAALVAAGAAEYAALAQPAAGSLKRVRRPAWPALAWGTTWCKVQVLVQASGGGMTLSQGCCGERGRRRRRRRRGPGPGPRGPGSRRLRCARAAPGGWRAAASGSAAPRP